MAICSMCGSEFDPEFAEDEFVLNHGDRCYENFNGPHCYDCAHEVIEEGIEGHYHEFCEECGTKFDLFEDNLKFMFAASKYDNADLLTVESYSNRILCADCAIDYMREQFPHGGGF